MPPFLPSSACVLLLLVTLASLSIAQQAPSTPDSRPARPNLPSLFLVGDTAVRNAPDQHPLASEPLFDLFDHSRINLVDRTLDHRTSRSYITGGDWQRTLALIKSGDFVLFQFADSDPGLAADTTSVPGTLPGIGDEIRELQRSNEGQPEIVHTYGWYLRLYVVETIARGAIPILCSQPPALRGTQVVGSPADERGDWARQIASQQRVVFLDLTTAATALKAGSKGAADGPSRDTSAPMAEPPALLVAQSAIAALKGLPNDPLAGYFSAKAASIKPVRPSQELRDLSRRSPDMPAPRGSTQLVNSF